MFCLSGQPLDVSVLTADEAPLGDLDGDGVSEDAAAELLGLEGATVEVSGHLDEQLLTVLAVGWAG